MVKRRYVPNKKRAAMRIALLALIPIVLAGAVIGAIRLIKGSGALPASSALPFSSDDVYAYTGTGFWYMGSGRLSYLDMNDESKNTSFAVSSEDVKLDSSGTLTALYNTGAVQLIGVEHPLEFTGVVESVVCGTSHIAVLRRDGEGKLSLQVFDSAGTKIDQIDYGADEIMNFGIVAGESDVLWTLTLSLTGSVPVTTLTTYDMAKSATTGVVSILNQLIEHVVFTETSIFAVGTENVIRYSRAGNTESYRLLDYGARLLDSSGSLFIFAPREAQTLSAVKMFSATDGDVSTSVVTHVQLPARALAAFASNGRLAVITDSALLLYAADGKQLSEQKLPIAADHATGVSDTLALIGSGGTLYALPIK